MLLLTSRLVLRINIHLRLFFSKLTFRRKTAPQALQRLRLWEADMKSRDLMWTGNELHCGTQCLRCQIIHDCVNLTNTAQCGLYLAEISRSNYLVWSLFTRAKAFYFCQQELTFKMKVNETWGARTPLPLSFMSGLWTMALKGNTAPLIRGHRGMV